MPDDGVGMHGYRMNEREKERELASLGSYKDKRRRFSRKFLFSFLFQLFGGL